MTPDIHRLKLLTKDRDRDAALKLLQLSYRTNDHELRYECAEVLASFRQTIPVATFCWSEVARLTCSKCKGTGRYKEHMAVGSLKELDDSTRVRLHCQRISEVILADDNVVSVDLDCDCRLAPQDTRRLYNLAVSIKDLELCRQAMKLWYPYDLAPDRGWWRWFRDWTPYGQAVNSAARENQWSHSAVRAEHGETSSALNLTGSWVGSCFPSMPTLPECICIEAGVERGRCPTPIIHSFVDGEYDRCGNCNGTGMCPRCGDKR